MLIAKIWQLLPALTAVISKRYRYPSLRIQNIKSLHAASAASVLIFSSTSDPATEKLLTCQEHLWLFHLKLRIGVKWQSVISRAQGWDSKTGTVSRSAKVTHFALNSNWITARVPWLKKKWSLRSLEIDMLGVNSRTWRWKKRSLASICSPDFA